MTSLFKRLFGSKPERTLATTTSGSMTTAASHEHAHEILAHVQVLIATSEDLAISGYLQGESAPDVAMAVGIIDGLLADEDRTSFAYEVTAKARQALIAELKLRGESRLLAK